MAGSPTMTSPPPPMEGYPTPQATDANKNGELELKRSAEANVKLKKSFFSFGSHSSFSKPTLPRNSKHSTSNSKAIIDADATIRHVRGGGILASRRELEMDPEEFARGCNLLQAAAAGNLEDIQRLLCEDSTRVNFRDYDRRTALHVASAEGHLNVVQFLVEAGAYINRSDRWGGSPLDDAHRHCHDDVVAFLRRLGATTGVADRTTNLITASAEGDVDEVRMLLATTTYRQGASNEIAAVNRSQHSSSSLSGHSINLNGSDYDGRTALHLAAGEGHAVVVELLCQRGANVNAEDRWGGRPLDDARRRNFTDCISILERYGAEAVFNGKGGRPLIKRNLTISEDGVQEVEAAIKGDSQKQDQDYPRRTIISETATSEELLSNLLIDFGELEMIDRIGTGAFGEIYKCRWRGILVAAKCIKSTRIVRKWRTEERDRLGQSQTSISSAASGIMNEEEQETALEDFRRETAILRTVRHPNICMLLAYSTTENFEVMVSELMKCSLLDVFKANSLHNTPMARKTQILYAQQLAQGMHYLHTCKPPILHRDLKPANLLIDFNGSLKISDFGLAKIRPNPERSEHEAFMMTGETGSFRFMAPEVFRHEDYTETVDVYSYAMIFYFLLAGKAPWASLNGLRAATKAAMDGDRPFIPREWDQRLSKLLQQCWDENPHTRPPFYVILAELRKYSADVFKTQIDTVPIIQDQGGCRCTMM